MTNQMALILTAATVGFVAAIFFCVGNVLNSPSQITAQATPYWDFSEPLASNSRRVLKRSNSAMHSNTFRKLLQK